MAMDGPSAAPRMIRLATRTANDTAPAIGNNVSAQIDAAAAMIHFVATRSAMKPTPTADNE